ncbi:DNA cytosine methyltransferase, partial [Ensifer sp. SSB1]|uniref:DNA cytosine methyltransferase n=1 Tax=Ensifer sp. SSB1 TaxID=2795385 RepID=UPI001A59C5A2
KANWDWPVVQTDLKKVKDSALARYRGIDLLAGGIPSAAFSRRSGESKRGSDDDLLPDLLRAVRAISPRGFMFEGTRGITFEPNLPYLAEFNAQLAAVGYTVDVVRLNSADFGLPVDDERIVIVGIRNDEAGAFIPPVLQNPTRKFVSEALGDLVIRYETAPALQDTVVRNTPQWDYDRWAKRWRKRFEGKLLSTIPRESTEIREVRLNAAKDAGFDRSRFSDEATRVEEFPNVDDDYFLPKLTVAVLARAQGFPDKWSFHAERGGNIDMIADALPPVVAKAVGLQIYSALTGISFDLDAAIAEPIINESMIGRKLRLNAGRVRWDVLQKAEMLVRGEAAILEPGAKKRKVMQQALIKDVEPNHMKRTHLREVAERIRWERERQQMEDDAWEERLFPNGVPEGAAD